MKRQFNVCECSQFIRRFANTVLFVFPVPVMESDVHCCAVGKYTMRCVITQLLCTLPFPGSLKATTALQQVVDIARISRTRLKHRTA